MHIVFRKQDTLQHTCNTLQHSALHCNTLQHAAILCKTLPHTTSHPQHTHNTPAAHLQHTRNTCTFGGSSKNGRDTQFSVNETHCNILHCTATHYSTLQHTAELCITQHHTASHCNTPATHLQHTRNTCTLGGSGRDGSDAQFSENKTHCNTPTLQHIAEHCNTLQHSATHCITL